MQSPSHSSHILSVKLLHVARGLHFKFHLILIKFT